MYHIISMGPGAPTDRLRGSPPTEFRRPLCFGPEHLGMPPCGMSWEGQPPWDAWAEQSRGMGWGASSGTETKRVERKGL